MTMINDMEHNGTNDAKRLVYKTPFVVDIDKVTGNEILQLYYPGFAELNYGKFGENVTVKVTSPLVMKNTYEFMYNRLNSNINKTSELGLPIKGFPQGPHFVQAPVDFDPDSKTYLQDMSSLTPTEYRKVLVKFIKDHGKKFLPEYLTLLPPEQYSEGVYTILNIYLWVLTLRSMLDKRLYDTEEFFSPITIQELEIVEEWANRRTQNMANFVNAWLKDNGHLYQNVKKDVLIGLIPSLIYPWILRNFAKEYYMGL